MFNWPLILGDPFGIVLLVLLLAMALLSVYGLGSDFMKWLNND